MKIFDRAKNYIRETINPFQTKEKQNTSESGKFRDRAVTVASDSESLKIAAVFRAVSLISDSVGVLPLIFKRKDAAKGYFKHYNEGTGKNIYYLLSQRPNRKQTAFIFFKNLVSQVLLNGNSYAYLRRGSDGNPLELILLSRYSCTYDIFSDTYWVEDQINNIRGVFSSEDILHFKNISLDGGLTGISTIRFAAETLGIAATATQETMTRFATGGKIKGILYSKNASAIGVGAYQEEQLEAAANQLQKDMDEGADIFRIRGEGDFKQLSLSSVDMQYLENVKFTVTEIARFFNVPKAKLFDDSNGSYKSPEAATIDFYSDCLLPILTMIEQEFASKMIPFESLGSYKFSFDISKLYSTDLDTKSKYNAGQIANGMATVNDIRRNEDLPPVEGGDQIFISCNVAPINSAKITGEKGNQNQTNQ